MVWGAGLTDMQAGRCCGLWVAGLNHGRNDQVAGSALLLFSEGVMHPICSIQHSPMLILVNMNAQMQQYTDRS